MPRIDGYMLAQQRPQDVAFTAYSFIQPFGDEALPKARGLVSLGMALSMSCAALGVRPEDVMTVVNNILAEAGNSFRTENTEHVRALRLFIEGEMA